MSKDIRRFLLDTVIRLNNGDDEGVSGDAVLGADGLNLDSLSIAELALLSEGEFGVNLDGEELDRFAGMTIDGFAAEIARLAGASTSSGRSE